MKRTDLAVEFAPKHCSVKETDKLCKRTEVRVDAALSAKLKKPQGRYVTIETCAVREGRKDSYGEVAKKLSDALGSLKKGENCLVVGLGNPNMTADALGKRVCDRLLITRHLGILEERLAKVCCLCPNVLGVTGIESFDIVAGVTERVKPDCIIVIDSLAGASTARIASAFQVSDAGITPGSGVSNHRTRFDLESLGRQVISMGVPLVVYASTIIEDAFRGKAGAYDADVGSLIVTPKDVDVFVDDCAGIIADAINASFFGADKG